MRLISSIVRAVGCGIFLASGLVAQAQTYPERSVRVIVPFAVGGHTDIIGRLVSHKLSTALGQSFVVENRAGAGGMIGADLLAKAAPDGYTLMVMSLPFTVLPSLHAKLPYDARKDITPVTMLASGPMLAFVHPSVPAKTIDELIAYAKANPGKINFGSAGPGSTPHLATELFMTLSGTKMTHVPYKGGGPAMVDLLSGQISLLIESMPLALPHLKEGKIRALAVTGPKRAAFLPDVPTLDERGLRGYEVLSWNGLFAPSGTPQPIIDRLHAEMVKILAMPDVQQRLAELGSDAVGDTPQQFRTFVDAEIEKWSKVVKETGMKTQ